MVTLALAPVLAGRRAGPGAAVADAPGGGLGNGSAAGSSPAVPAHEAEEERQPERVAQEPEAEPGRRSGAAREPEPLHGSLIWTRRSLVWQQRTLQGSRRALRPMAAPCRAASGSLASALSEGFAAARQTLLLALHQTLSGPRRRPGAQEPATAAAPEDAGGTQPAVLHCLRSLQTGLRRPGEMMRAVRQAPSSPWVAAGCQRRAWRGGCGGGAR